MAELAYLFPVSVYREENLLSEIELAKLKKHSLKVYKEVPCGVDSWTGNTYATLNTLNLKDDKVFTPLLNKIAEHVQSFSKMHGSENAEYDIESSWLNVNEKNSFQEFHTHNGSIFSAVYWVATPEGSGNLVFEDPKDPDMFPVKNINEHNELSYTRYTMNAQENVLILFRSYLRHMVLPCENKKPRISIAVNYR
tara:strand:- start:387 stop:971 length:585 start_codon:yes stop_codon:yes gene_type:complete